MQNLGCAKHGPEARPLDFEGSLQASYVPNQLVLKYFECKECKRQRLVNEKNKSWLRMGVPERTIQADFNNFKTDGDPKKSEVLKKVLLQVGRGTGFLILFGLYGTGKTHLMSAAFKSLVMQKEAYGIFVTFGELIDELRATYERGSKEKLVKKYQQTPVLVIDELEPLGKTRDGDIQSADIEPFLYRILAHRYDRELFTGLTSNLDLDKILAILGPRLQDRMAQDYTAASCLWESYRKQNRKTETPANDNS